jgi:hypothetical protein
VKSVRLLTDFGLYARYGLFGNVVYEYHSEEPKLDRNAFDVYNRFDVGLNLGVGLQIKQYFGMLSFHRGLSYAEKNINYYHEVKRVGVGYFF